MSFEEDNRTSLLVIFVVVLVVLAGGLVWIHTRRQEQMRLAEAQAAADAEMRLRNFKGPLRNPNFRPSVNDPKDADIVVGLGRHKAISEEVVRKLKATVNQQTVEGLVRLRELEFLYDKFRNSSDVCINCFIAAIERHLGKEDSTDIKTAMKDVNKHLKDFSKQANKELNRPDSWSPALEIFPQWLDDLMTNEHNDEEVAQLKALLEDCRIKKWEDVMPQPSLPINSIRDTPRVFA